MTANIATQIRARLDAIAAERSSFDDEERRLKKALEALEPTTPAEGYPSAEEILSCVLGAMKPESPEKASGFPGSSDNGPCIGQFFSAAACDRGWFDRLKQAAKAQSNGRRVSALVDDFVVEVELVRHGSGERFLINQQGPAY